MGLIGARATVSWKVRKGDGTEGRMFVGGTITNETDDDITLRGNDGEIFTIPVGNIISLSKKGDGNEKPAKAI